MEEGCEVPILRLHSCILLEELKNTMKISGVPRGGLGVFKPPPRNSEVLTKLSQIPSSVENTSVTT